MKMKQIEFQDFEYSFDWVQSDEQKKKLKIFATDRRNLEIVFLHFQAKNDNLIISNFYQK